MMTEADHVKATCHGLFSDPVICALICQWVEQMAQIHSTADVFFHSYGLCVVWCDILGMHRTCESSTNRSWNVLIACTWNWRPACSSWRRENANWSGTSSSATSSTLLTIAMSL